MNLKLSLLMITLVALTFSACKKDDDPTLQERMVGSWDVTSYTEDGVELVGSFIQAFTMRYDEYQGNEGSTRWTLTYFDGSTEIVNGFYTVNEENETLRVEADGDVIRLDIDLSGSRLILSGNVDGFSVNIRADRE